jgi:hypothetical protein
LGSRRSQISSGVSTKIYFDKQFRYLGNAANILNAVSRSEAEIAIKPVPDIVAVRPNWFRFCNC